MLTSSTRRCLLRATFFGCLCSLLSAPLLAQTVADKPSAAAASAPDAQALSAAPAKVDVNPVAHDEEIRARLQSVLEATNWFTSPHVEVREGVVFLDGRAPLADLKNWAGNLARSTQDVVAVVNRME